MPSRLMETPVTSPRTDWFDRTPFAKEIGLVALGIGMGMMIGSGWVNTDKISQVWHDANRDKAAAIHEVQAKIPKGAGGKTEHASSVPDCVGVTPSAIPKPSP